MRQLHDIPNSRFYQLGLTFDDGQYLTVAIAPAGQMLRLDLPSQANWG
jgi:hypothetical protein